MYLFGVDFEKIHLEAVKKEAREAARKEMFEEGQERDLRKLMRKLSMTAEQAMDTLDIPADEREKYATRLNVVPAEA